MSHLEALIRREVAPEPGPAAPGGARPWPGLRPWVRPLEVSRADGPTVAPPLDDLPEPDPAPVAAEAGWPEPARAPAAVRPAGRAPGEATPPEPPGPADPPARPRLPG